MNYNQLSIDQAPSISVPLSFIMAAPLFAIAAASILLLSGPEIFQNRWQASTLAITHLITLGFISMTMMGALFQLLPVLAGAQIPSPKITSRAIFSLYTLGVICLVAGFFLSHQLLSRAALLLLALGFLVFLLMVSYVLYKTDVSSGSVKGMRYAISSLWIAICLGLILLTGHAWDSFALLRHLTGLHIAWAAIGWMTILIISIAYQVIPMFQITASYPRFIERHFSTGIFLLLISWSLSQFFSGQSSFEPDALEIIFSLSISLILIIFTGLTLHMQLQRRKRMVDSAFYFWIFGLANLFIAQLLYSYSLFSGNNLDFVIGIVFFVGFAMSVINGMLYKIVPFLVWLHLHRKLAFDTQNRSKIPNMNDVISGKKSRLQLLMHVTSLGLLLLSVIKPDPLIYLAAIIWLINSVTLWVYLVQSIMLYKSCLTSK